MNTNKFIADFLRGDIGLINKIFIVLCTATAFFTYQGASLDAEGFLAKSRATVFAIASGSAIYLFWHVVLHVVPGLKKTWQKILSGISIVLGCCLIFWLSSAFNVAGLSGHQAQNIHMTTYAETLEGALRDQFAYAISITAVSSDIRMEMARFEKAAQDEHDHGSYSGSPGPGAVVSAFAGINQRLSELLKEADRFSKDIKAQNGLARKHLEDMRKVIASDRALHVRMTDLAKSSDQFHAALSQMSGALLGDAIARTLESLPREIDLQSHFSANPKTAQRQKEALDRVREDVKATNQLLGRFLSQASDKAPKTPPSFERISAVRAVMIYWSNFFPYWAGGLGIDIAPLSIIVFLMIALGSKTPQELVRLRILNATVDDLIAGKVGTDLLQRTGIDPQTLSALMDEALGRAKQNLGG